MPKNQPVSLQTRLLTAFLWLLTVILGAACIIFGQDILVAGITLAIGPVEDMDTVRARGTITTIYNCTFILNWLIWLGLVVGGAEYHFKHSGSPRSNRILTITLVVELALLGLVLLVRLL